MAPEALEKENEKLYDMVKAKAEELYPYFDSVRIFCTKHENNETGTTQMVHGCGNFFSSYGQIQLWCKEQNLSGEV